MVAKGHAHPDGSETGRSSEKAGLISILMRRTPVLEGVTVNVALVELSKTNESDVTPSPSSISIDTRESNKFCLNL